MDFRFGDPRGLSYPSRTMSNLGPSFTSEFQAAEKPPKPDANGLLGPFAINSFLFQDMVLISLNFVSGVTTLTFSI